MADEIDPRLEARLRAVLRADADAVPFTLRASVLEARLAVRQQARRRRTLGLAAAAVLVAVGVAFAALSIGRLDGDVAQPPSTTPTLASPPVESAAVPSPGAAGLLPFEELERLPSAPVSVIVRGEGGAGTTVIGDIAGQVDLRVAIACTGGEIRIQVGDGNPPSETAIACQPEGGTASIGTRDLASTVKRISVVAPAGTTWRVSVGTGEIAVATLPPEACARVGAPGQVRTLVLRDTVSPDTEKGPGAIVWAGSGEPPDTAATWDDSAGSGELGAYRGMPLRVDAQAFCIAGWRIEYAPVESVEAARAAGAAPSDVSVAIEGTASGAVHSVDFDLPDRGHYIVRAVLDWRLDDGSIGRDARLWRIWSDAAEFYPDIPHPDPAVPCGEPDLQAAAPPVITLVQDGIDVAAGVHMGGRWNGVTAPGAKSVPSASVDLATGAGLGLQIAGDVCAMFWDVSYGPVPTTTDGFLATGDPLAQQGNPAFDPAYARENRIVLGDLPPGDWMVEANLLFPEFPNGSRTWFRVHVGE